MSVLFSDLDLPNHNNDANEHHSKRLSRHYLKERLGARKIEFISTAVACTIFAICFAHLEYYYIKDPALQISNRESDLPFDDSRSAAMLSRQSQPVVGNMYIYHLFPMLFIFLLVSFIALFDDIFLKLLGKGKRFKAIVLGISNLVTAITFEDFAWFVNRLLVPLENDPKGGKLMQFTDWTAMHIGAVDIGLFVIPNWYLLSLGVAIAGYYITFRGHSE